MNTEINRRTDQQTASLTVKGAFLSLNQRLLAATALILIIFLGLVYLALEQAFVSSVTRTEAERLHSNILLLLAEAQTTEGVLSMPEQLQEARFNQLDSGLYAYIFNSDGDEIWRSYSAIALRDAPSLMPFKNAGVGQDYFGLTEVYGEGFLYASMGVAWELDSGSLPSKDNRVPPKQQHYTFSLLESADFFHSELEAFRKNLLLRLLGVGALLLVAQLLVLRLGLLPLKRLSRDVQRVEQGEIQGLGGAYPKELHGLTENLNQLLEHEHKQREQYRNRMTDLAHSLKTPLAIASGALLDKQQDRDLLAEQLQQMDQIVQYQLQRAGRVRPALIQSKQAVSAVIERLESALQKVYSEKQITTQLQLDPNAVCRVDEGDLMELLGNLMDNAFKYCDSCVAVETQSHAKGCSIRIADDGSGIPADRREKIFARGQRLDTQAPGQGIGLAVVNDIANSYSITVSIGSSDLGGALFMLELP